MTMQAERIRSIPALEELYGAPGAPAMRKVAHRMTPLYREWIMASKLCILSTVGPEGTDASPRGDDGPVVVELDPGTLLMPDWRGNNRLDSLRNIVRDGRLSLLFLVSGSHNVVRVNGNGWLTSDLKICGQFEKSGRLPATVIVIDILEIYTQCARALMRADFWNQPDDKLKVPTVGAILAEMTDCQEGGRLYDEAWRARADKTMW